MLLSAAMIVRDEERHLASCVEPIAPAVDEIVVVDTGSVDRTAEIAARHGAEVHRLPWTDDFSAASRWSSCSATPTRLRFGCSCIRPRGGLATGNTARGEATPGYGSGA